MNRRDLRLEKMKRWHIERERDVTYTTGRKKANKGPKAVNRIKHEKASK